jgi:hypothetical protein
MIEFCKTPIRRETLCGRHVIFNSKCKQYRVVKSISDYHLPTVWYAFYYVGFNFWLWVTPERKPFKTRQAAEKACRDHQRASEPAKPQRIRRSSI